MGKLFSFLIVFVIGCTASRKIGHSYTTVVIDIANNKSKEIFKNYFISYKNYLFEFEVSTNYESTVNSKSRNDIVTLDTVGVYIIFDKKYYKFSSFSDTARFLEHGSLLNKSTGFHLPIIEDSIYEKSKVDSNYFYGKLVDTSINNIKLHFVDVIPKIKSDTVKTSLILLKNEKLNTPFSVSGIRYKNNEYKIVGSYSRLMNKNEQVYYGVSDFKNLNQHQIKICDALLLKIPEK